MLKYKLLVASILLITVSPILLLLRSSELEGVNKSSKASLTCGPTSLAAAANMIGIPLSVNDAIKKCEITENGTSFGALKLLAESYHLKTQLLYLNWEQLKRLDTSCVLHIKERHFIVADPRKKSDNTKSGSSPKIWIYDPDAGGMWITSSELQKIWNGACLKISLDPSKMNSYPSLYTTSYWVDHGLRMSIDNEHYKIPIWNLGNEPIKIDVEETSCQCSQAILSQSIIEPGEVVYLFAEVSLKHKRGAFKEHVYIRTSDPKAKRVTFTMGGTAYNSALISQDEIFLGQLVRGQSFEENIVVRDPGVQTLEIVSCEPISYDDKPLDDITCSAFARKVREQEISKLSSIWGKVSKNDYVIHLSGIVKSNSPISSSKFKLNIETNLPGKHSNLYIPVNYEIIRNVFSKPAAVLFSNPRTDEVIVKLAHRDDSSLRITSIKSIGNLPISADIRSSSDKNCLVKIQIDSQNKEIIIDDGSSYVECSTENGEVLSIPIIFSNHNNNSDNF